MKYAIAIEHQEGAAVGVIVPDIPGCFSAGDDLEDALTNAREAIEFHLEGLEAEGMPIPEAGAINAHFENPDYKGMTWGFVDVDVTPYLGKTEKINVTLPSFVIRKIDGQYANRSLFLAEAALEKLGIAGKAGPAVRRKVAVKRKAARKKAPRKAARRKAR